MEWSRSTIGPTSTNAPTSSSVARSCSSRKARRGAAGSAGEFHVEDVARVERIDDLAGDAEGDVAGIGELDALGGHDLHEPVDELHQPRLTRRTFDVLASGWDVGERELDGLGRGLGECCVGVGAAFLERQCVEGLHALFEGGLQLLGVEVRVGEQLFDAGQQLAGGVGERHGAEALADPEVRLVGERLGHLVDEIVDVHHHARCRRRSASEPAGGREELHHRLHGSTERRRRLGWNGELARRPVEEEVLHVVGREVGQVAVRVVEPPRQEGPGVRDERSVVGAVVLLHPRSELLHEPVLDGAEGIELVRTERELHESRFARVVAGSEGRDPRERDQKRRDGSSSTRNPSRHTKM